MYPQVNTISNVVRVDTAESRKDQKEKLDRKDLFMAKLLYSE